MKAYSSTLGLAFVIVGLIIYASLFPFENWRYQGLMPWHFLTQSWPKSWNRFDVIINILGYIPLGLFAALGFARSRALPRLKAHAWLGAWLLACTLSLVMESTQTYLPIRVPSTLDWAMNALGAAMGVIAAWYLQSSHWLVGWRQWQTQGIGFDATPTLVLLSLWPLALLAPLPMPFGLGDILLPLMTWLAQPISLQTAVSVSEPFLVCLGLLVPLLMAYGIGQRVHSRILLALCLFFLAWGATSMTTALSLGPQHALEWWSEGTAQGVWSALALSVVFLALPRRMCWLIALVVLTIHCTWINLAPTNPYFNANLVIWEQGRFIRFYGAAQWLAWCWPYAALVYILVLLGKRRAS